MGHPSGAWRAIRVPGSWSYASYGNLFQSFELLLLTRISAASYDSSKDFIIYKYIYIYIYIYMFLGSRRKSYVPSEILGKSFENPWESWEII